MSEVVITLVRQHLESILNGTHDSRPEETEKIYLQPLGLTFDACKDVDTLSALMIRLSVRKHEYEYKKMFLELQQLFSLKDTNWYKCFERNDSQMITQMLSQLQKIHAWREKENVSASSILLKHIWMQKSFR